VFCNAILTQRLTGLLEDRGLRVLRHQVVPPNDGGLSLGQAVVASARAASGSA
jgi:hydrogenase maturation protein HypF